jgi:hypothetical protein
MWSIKDSFDPLRLTLCIDMGKSLNKVVYSVLPNGPQKLILMEPEVASLSKKLLSDLTIVNCNPEDDAWIKLNDGTGLAFGLLAQKPNYRLQSNNKKKEQKFEMAASRCGAIICAIAEKEGLGRNCYRGSQFLYKRVRVALEVLLPLSEYYSHKEELMSSLLGEENAFTLNFRSKNYEIQFSCLDVKPEGAGQLMIRQADSNAQPFKSRNILCLIFGHYNITGILYRRGQIQRKDCPSIGFFQIVESVADNTGLDKTNIPEARLAEAVYFGRDKPEYIRAFLLGSLSNSKNLSNQAERIFQAIEQSTLDYWVLVERWLKDFLAEDLVIVDEVLVTGGASKKLEKQLKEFFAHALVVRGGSSGVVKAIRHSFNLKANDPLIDRLVECFGVHTALLQKILNKELLEKS